MQVAAPPKGSISVGWLCVSFLKSSSHGCSSPSTSTVIFTVQALISSLSSRFGSIPRERSTFAAIVPMSMRFTGFVRPIEARAMRYSSYACCSRGSANVTRSSVVRNVVWRQWSDQ